MQEHQHQGNILGPAILQIQRDALLQSLSDVGKSVHHMLYLVSDSAASLVRAHQLLQTFKVEAFAQPPDGFRCVAACLCTRQVLGSYFGPS